MSFDWEKDALKEAADELVPTRLRAPRTPLLWALVPLVGGYSCALVSPPPGWAWAGVGVFVGAGVALWSARGAIRRPRAAVAPAGDAGWAVGFITAVWLLSWLWYAACCPAAPDRAGLPPREAVLSVRVEEFFQSSTDGAASGVGTVEAAPAHLGEMVGARIQFRMTGRGKLLPEADLGARLRLRGILAAAPEEGGFARYLRGRGIGFTLSRGRCESVEVAASGFRQACTRARARVTAALREGVGRDDGARIAALMLGRTSLLPKAEREDFKTAGATHLFAISGLHITGIAAALLWCARRCRVRGIAALPVILGVLWLYVQMAGAPPSAMRAWWMAAAIGGAWVLVRGARLFHGLAIAALITLIAEPAAIRDPGFLLSYVVVAALLLYAAPLTVRMDRGWRPWRYIPPDALSFWKRGVLRYKYAMVSAAAATGTAGVAGMPLAAALFGRVSWIGFLANPLLIPLSAPAVLAGFAASALGAVGLGDYAAPFNRIAAWSLEAVARGAHLAAGVPWAASSMPDMTPPATWGGALVVMCALLAYPPGEDRPVWRYAVMPIAVAGWFAAGLCA